MGPHNLYNVDDFCPSMDPDAPGYSLADWDAAMAPNADGTLPRMDKLLHDSPSGPAPGDEAMVLGSVPPPFAFS